MSNLKIFLRKNLPSVIVLGALVIIIGIALVTKFSVSADTAAVNLGAETNYADEDTTILSAGDPVVLEETLDEAITTSSRAASATATASATASSSVTSTAACSTTTVVPATTVSPVSPARTTTVPCVSATATTVYKQGLKGTYFKDKTLTRPVLARLDSTVNFDWGSGSAGTNVPSDAFSVRWTGFITPKYSETYTFGIQHNDGVRLYIDNKTVIDKWSNTSTNTSFNTDSGTIALTANKKYSIRLEYYDNTARAMTKLYWKSTSQAQQVVPSTVLSTTYNPNPANGTGNGLIGTYFNGLNFNTRIASRRDQAINFNWSTGSPIPKVATDNFSAVWTGKVQPKFSEVYTFYAKSSDGARVWVNGVKVIDKWVDQPTVTENKGAIRLVAGQKYNIRVQYYDKTGVAASILMWSSPSQRKQVVPKLQLYSGNITTPTPSASTTTSASATTTTTSTTSATATSTSRKVVIKKGFNTVAISNGDGIVPATDFTSKGMKVFAFNRDGKYYTHPTSEVNWETALKYMYPGTGYYVYNPGNQATVTLSTVKTPMQPKDRYVTTGWNLLSNSWSAAIKLDADPVKYYLSSACSISTGIPTCTTLGEQKTLKALIQSKKGYAVIPLIKDGNTSDATKAFEYITVTDANINTVELPALGTFWFFIFQ